MGLLYGRAGRLTAKNGGFRRGQKHNFQGRNNWMHITSVRRRGMPEHPTQHTCTPRLSAAAACLNTPRSTPR
jgi:hypothetical protein